MPLDVILTTPKDSDECDILQADEYYIIKLQETLSNVHELARKSLI